MLLFTSFTATYAQKSQNSDFAHVCLGFITRKQRENTSRWQRVNSNEKMLLSSVTGNAYTKAAKKRASPLHHSLAPFIFPESVFDALPSPYGLNSR